MGVTVKVNVRYVAFLVSHLAPVAAVGVITWLLFGAQYAYGAFAGGLFIDAYELKWGWRVREWMVKRAEEKQ
jgi:hypothetical protein